MTYGMLPGHATPFPDNNTGGDSDDWQLSPQLQHFLIMLTIRVLQDPVSWKGATG